MACWDVHGGAGACCAAGGAAVSTAGPGAIGPASTIGFDGDAGPAGPAGAVGAGGAGEDARPRAGAGACQRSPCCGACACGGGGPGDPLRCLMLAAGMWPGGGGAQERPVVASWDLPRSPVPSCVQSSCAWGCCAGGAKLPLGDVLGE
mmetsp:Transcript_19862/g.43889  ORF Transcript_19862/g.43889 Transcript_19862/m.43889 type:complete len:148 (+) Transcript_19862:1320-1763(+)